MLVLIWNNTAMLFAENSSVTVISSEPFACFSDRTARTLVEVSSDPAALDQGGFWAIASTYEGQHFFARFAEVSRFLPEERAQHLAQFVPEGAHKLLPYAAEWQSSLSQADYEARVHTIHEAIDAGVVRQLNLCRKLTTNATASMNALAQALAHAVPAPHAALLSLPEYGIEIASASPELFLQREGDQVSSGPIKGTATSRATMLPKDHAENELIVKLVCEELAQICDPDSVTIPDLLQFEPYADMVHLVSRVTGTLRPEVGWAHIFAALLPAGSISGTPKGSAQRLIREMEPTPRGFYCGVIGWVDADTHTASLGVGIRTFTRRQHLARNTATLSLGVGAGITRASDPTGEWRETEIKAAPLMAAVHEARPAPQLAIEANSRAEAEAEAEAGAENGADSMLSTAPWLTWHSGVPDEVLGAGSQLPIDPHHSGFLTGEGLFETILIRNGMPVWWEEHLERLSHSLAALWQDQSSSTTWRKQVQHGWQQLQPHLAMVPEAKLRLTVIPHTNQPSQILLTTAPLASRPAAQWVRTVGPWAPSHLSAHKSLSYGAMASLARKHAPQGWDEVILSDSAGYLIEGTRSNIFLIRGDEIHTPPVNSGALAGIARSHLLRVGQELGLNTVIKPIPQSSLSQYEAAFLSSCLSPIQPISAWDEYRYSTANSLFEKLQSSLFI